MMTRESIHSQARNWVKKQYFQEAKNTKSVSGLIIANIFLLCLETTSNDFYDHIDKAVYLL
jgi:hypothetical protein